MIDWLSNIIGEIASEMTTYGVRRLLFLGIFLVVVLFIIWGMAPGLKWKVLFSFGTFFAIILWLAGIRIPALTPMGKKI